MVFLNRFRELQRIDQFLSAKEQGILVLYGRRRIGKTRLIRQITGGQTIFYVADQTESQLQIQAFARLVSHQISGFDSAHYPNWESCLRTLNDRLSSSVNVIIDEFPYLVKNTPELPSILQKLFDDPSQLRFKLILCGSSQQMMHNLVIDSTSPLYGRASELIRLMPMSVYWLRELLQCSSVEAIEEYCIWGGVPRYWELRIQEKSRRDAVIRHILDSGGILHEEPVRLFLDDSRDTVQTASLISIVSSGVNRLSEIAARVGKPATSLTRPLKKLIDLGYLKREIPFGTSPRNAKKTLYKISDPFIHFYYRYVAPDRPLLEMGLASEVYEEAVQRDFPEYCSGQWEELCRGAVPLLFPDKLFQPGNRWWGGRSNKEQAEIDVVSISKDKSELIVGEVKWSESVNLSSICQDLNKKIHSLPGIEHKAIRKVLFLKNRPDYLPEDFLVFTPEEVVGAYGT